MTKVQETIKKIHLKWTEFVKNVFKICEEDLKGLQNSLEERFPLTKQKKFDFKDYDPNSPFSAKEKWEEWEDKLKKECEPILQSREYKDISHMKYLLTGQLFINFKKMNSFFRKLSLQLASQNIEVNNPERQSLRPEEQRASLLRSFRGQQIPFEKEIFLKNEELTKFLREKMKEMKINIDRVELTQVENYAKLYNYERRDDFYVGESITLDGNKISHGFGVYYSKEMLYVGEWELNQRSGHGYQQYALGNSFHGLFKEDQAIRGVFQYQGNQFYGETSKIQTGIINAIYKRIGEKPHAAYDTNLEYEVSRDALNIGYIDLRDVENYTSKTLFFKNPKMR